MIRLFLVTTAIGLGLIGLGYGLSPSFYPSLYGYTLTTVNEAHIFRALAGLYGALASYWLMAASRPSMHRAALQSIAVVMAGLASGRVISLVVDGVPHWLLLAFLAMELAVLAQAVWLGAFRAPAQAAT